MATNWHEGGSLLFPVPSPLFLALFPPLSLVQVGGEAQEVEVTETFAPIAGEEPDLLETLDNESATAALEVVRSLKLPKEELAALVPADWDATTVDWFTDTKKGEELPLPSYRLTFLWGDNNLLAAVDQVGAQAGAVRLPFTPPLPAQRSALAPLPAQCSAPAPLPLALKLSSRVPFAPAVPPPPARRPMRAARTAR